MAETPEITSGLVVAEERIEVNLSEMLATMDLDEAQIMYETAGVVQEDFMPADPNGTEEEKQERDREIERMLTRPAFKKAVALIAYRRAHPEASPAEMQERVGKANVLGLTLAMLGEDDEIPPESSSQQPPENVRPINQPSSSEASGSTSGSASDEPDGPRANTGATR